MCGSEGQYVHVCVHADAHVLRGGEAGVCRGQKLVLAVFPTSLSWSFETEPLSEPGAHQFKQIGYPVSSQGPPVPTCSALSYRHPPPHLEL